MIGAVQEWLLFLPAEIAMTAHGRRFHAHSAPENSLVKTFRPMHYRGTPRTEDLRRKLTRSEEGNSWGIALQVSWKSPFRSPAEPHSH